MTEATENGASAEVAGAAPAAIAPSAALTVRGLDTTAYEPRNLSQATQMATVLARSGLLGKVEPKPETVLFLMARGRELGFSTAQSIQAFHILDGQPSLKAQAQVALCKRRRDVCEYIVWAGGDAESSTWETQRVGDPSPVRFTYRIEDATLMGLTVKKRKADGSESGDGPWQKQPATMLRWRAATTLIAMVYPDLVLGLYDPEEYREAATADGRVVRDDSFAVDAKVIEGRVVETAQTFGDDPEPVDPEDALAKLADNPTPPSVPGVDRPFQEGDACPECARVRRKSKYMVAKGGPHSGELECSFKVNGDWQHHSPPHFVPVAEARVASFGPCPQCAMAQYVTRKGATPVYVDHHGDILCNGVDAEGEPQRHLKAAESEVASSELPSLTGVGSAAAREADRLEAERIVQEGDVNPDEIPF